ncbi:MAG: hypothetical protein R3E50_04295 [Halioglobus sp.]
MASVDAHPMAIMCGVVGALSSFIDSLEISDEHHRQIAAFRLIAKNAHAGGHMSYKYANGQPFMCEQQSELRGGVFPPYDVRQSC